MTDDERPADRKPRAGTMLPLGWWKEPPWVELSPGERDLLTRLLSYSADLVLVTGGRIPATIVSMLAYGSAESDPETGTALVGGLTGRGLLARLEDGSVAIPPEVLTVFNLSAAEVQARKASAAERGRHGGESTAERYETERDPITGRILGKRPRAHR